MEHPVTDQLADVLHTPSEDGDMNLQREGIPPEKIFRVGNVMIKRRIGTKAPSHILASF